ncbi:signal transduction histidine kinase [Actimicrobium sp. GrIS 1.19]|uniref:sensor histidine kinase n=1 Tax=Actimicrobium sp. GrIS 1.19 TaxID=3071708 RepID=UPI002E095888|nr:signal transduction histidine kinase [Actimicrobium sp. GrIS 1.19]
MKARNHQLLTIALALIPSGVLALSLLDADVRVALVAASPAVLIGLLGMALSMAVAVSRLTGALVSAAHAAVAHGDATLPAHSGVAEVDQLTRALSDTAAELAREKKFRALADAERTHLFASEHAARQLAEAQNHAKDQFLALLSHQLRNPLSVIGTAIAVMDHEKVTPDHAAKAYAMIRRQSAELSRIVDDLLDLDRIISGQARLAPQRIDLAAATRLCLETLRVSGQLDQHTFSADLTPAWVNADPARLEQIIANLIGNALHVSARDGAIEIEVNDADGGALLVVRDHGQGMSADMVPRAFDVFVPDDSRSGPVQGHLGIGLAMVRKLSALHGGTVSAESAGLGLGSTFTLQLPRAA